MRLRGLQRVTLLDFPGKVACTVFTVGCNFRCPFCHNASLVPTGRSDEPDIEEEDFFAFLATRQGKLDGVCISGGEPLLQPDIRAFIERIHGMGFAVKLDTNGSFPARLAELIKGRLIDYVAMDIKGSPETYARVTGLSEAPVDRIGESVRLLLASGVPFEFRTTVVNELHDVDDFFRIGEWIAGAPKYYLQEFTDSGDILSAGCHAMSHERMCEAAKAAQSFIPEVAIR